MKKDKEGVDDLDRYGTPAIYTNAADPLTASSINSNEVEREECLNRFRNELRHILETMKNILRETLLEEFRSKTTRPFTVQFYLLLQMTDIEWLVNWYIERIPCPVQELLGDATTTMAQLLEHLPRIPAYEKRHDCYVDLAEHQETGEVRRYVGSGTSKDGAWNRMRCYIRQEKCNYEDCTEQGIHQRWICDPDVTPNLFALALFDSDPKHRPFVLLLKAIFMVMLRSIDLEYTPFEYFPQASIDLVGDGTTITAGSL